MKLIFWWREGEEKEFVLTNLYDNKLFRIYENIMLFIWEYVYTTGKWKI